MPSSSAEQQDCSPAQQSGGSSTGRFSLHSLSAAFARLTGTHQPQLQTPDTAGTVDLCDDDQSSETAANVVSPRTIVEGMLFVGNSEGQPLTNRQLAAHIRDVSPKEIDELIAELNQTYREAGTAYEIISQGAGYQMQLRPAYDAIGQRFHGRLREAKLTPPAIEVLSIVAYRQPVTAEQVAKLRGSRSSVLLNQLVRRGLLQLQRTSAESRKPSYHTTERFNRLFQIESLQDLPSSEDLDDS